ncbi:MAG: glycosyltransferase, partial [Desulfobacterales bacterium]
NTARNLMNHVAGANMFNIFQTIGEAGGLYAMLAPYFISFSYFAEDRVFSDKVIAHFNPRDVVRKSDAIPNNERVVAHFSDRLENLRPLARTLNRKAADFIYGPAKIMILTCGEPWTPGDQHVRVFQPVGTYDHPELPNHKLLFPPFLEMLNCCFSRRVTHIHSATPGPVGLAALGVARILKLPVYGTFHRNLSDYKPFMGEDESAVEVLQRFMSWYYDQLDRIFVFSADGLDRLTQSGVDAKKISLVPRSIDIHRFQPDRTYRSSSAGRQGKEPIRLLYCGPVRRENNLPLLTEVYKTLLSHKKNIHLIVIGDGPYRFKMKRLLQGYPCTFHAHLADAELNAVYAGGTVFVCPGADIARGRRIMEAQACGLPLVVTDHERLSRFISPGETGLAFAHNDATALYEALLRLIDDPALRDQMGMSARRQAESLALDAAAFRAFDPVDAPAPADANPRLAEAV